CTIPRPSTSTLFPYTTLFRSRRSNTLTSLRVISRGELPARPIEHVHVNRCPADVLVFSAMSSEVETSLTISRPVLVQRALHPQPRTIQHVRINHRCAHVLYPVR